MTNQLRLLSITAICALLAACVSDTSVGENQGEVSGTLNVGSGHTAPSAGNVYVLWEVSAGSPDYAYAYGGGALDAGRFSLSFGGAPPDEAFNGDLAFGIVVLLDADTTLTEGVVEDIDSPAMEAAILGLSTRHAVIYRRSTGIMYRDWEGAFPVGEYSCGRAVETEGTFDDFEPIDCGELEIRVDDLSALESEFFNWT